MSGNAVARPIPFSAPMVLALLEGRKSQTRRIVTPAPPQAADALRDIPGENWWWAARATEGEIGTAYLPVALGQQYQWKCPYGKAGDLIYVKEAWRVPKSLDELSGSQIAEKCLDAGYTKPWCPIQYECDLAKVNGWAGFDTSPLEAEPGRYRHARFMPRWASRITLRITDVRVERLQAISRRDCFAEGTPALAYPQPPGGYVGTEDGPARAYRHLWESLHGPDSWSENPFVWRICFERA